MKRAVYTIGIFIVGILAFLLGCRYGVEQYARLQYKVNLSNLIELTENESDFNETNLLNLLKAQTYSTSKYVPDSWLPVGKDFGPVQTTLNRALNFTKDPTSLQSDYDQWRRRMESEDR